MNRFTLIGQYLTEMVMPVIGAFIAWGLLAAIFISPGGWFPNETLYKISPYFLNFLIPILIAGQGGKIIGGTKGRVVASIAIMGCIAFDWGTYTASLNQLAGQQALVDAHIISETSIKPMSIPMLMPAMVIGPLSGWIIKKFDQFTNGKVTQRWQLLVDNFSVGIIGLLLAIACYFSIGPIMNQVIEFFAFCVKQLVEFAIFPLIAIFIEPAKVLFLNNALNLGIFTPIGEEQVQATGKSMMFLLETNPGPGLGMLVAIWVFSRNKAAKETAPEAIIIQSLGGIHEVYFPYILACPLLIFAPMIGNMIAISLFCFVDTGAVGVPSPGSIFTFLMMAEIDDLWEAAAGILLSAAVSFAIAIPIIRRNNRRIDEQRKAKLAVKKKRSDGTRNSNLVQLVDKDPALVTNIVFACTVGIGFSVMGATLFSKRLKKKRPDIIINNFSINNIPSNADIVVCESSLLERAKSSTNARCEYVEIENFLEDPALDNLFEKLTSVSETEAKEKKDGKNIHLVTEGIMLDLDSVSKHQAIDEAGRLLKKLGCCTDEYIQSMHDREEEATTYLGMGVAIPHGIVKTSGAVKKSGIVFLQYPDGVDFGEEKAYLIFGIAGVGNDYIDLLAKISNELQNEEIVKKLITTEDENEVLEMFS